MKSFNLVLFDFEAARIIHKKDGKSVTFHGLTDANPPPSLLPCETLSLLMHKKGANFTSRIFCIQIWYAEKENQPSTNYDALQVDSSTTLSPLQ